jgi:hypothetical protein
LFLVRVLLLCAKHLSVAAAMPFPPCEMLGDGSYGMRMRGSVLPSALAGLRAAIHYGGNEQMFGAESQDRTRGNANKKRRALPAARRNFVLRQWPSQNQKDHQ